MYRLIAIVCGFGLKKICKISGCEWKSTIRARATKVSRQGHGRANGGYASIAVPTVNQRASETGTVHEKVRFRSDVVRLRNS